MQSILRIKQIRSILLTLPGPFNDATKMLRSA